MNEISRRDFLGGVVGLAASLLGAHSRIFAYVGTYTGKAGNGQGIHIFSLDPATGALTAFDVMESDNSPSSLAFDPAGAHLYSANEDQSGKGTVSAYAVDRTTGRLRFLNTQSSGGDGPAHISVHPDGRHVFAANYPSGSVGVLPIRSDGGLDAPSDVKIDTGKLGPLHAASAAPGSFAISGHDAPHAHMVRADPSGRFVLSTDLGLDRIYTWKYHPAKGTLSPAATPFVSVPPGDGARHFDFHPNGRWFYCLTEEGSTLRFYHYDGATGGLAFRQSLSTLPAGFAGTSFASEVAVSPDGRFVYAANRLHDTVAIFAIGSDGAIELKGEEWTRASYPRHFAIDPTGNFLHVCNHRGDSVTTFRIDHRTGALAFTGRYTPVGSPSNISFLVLPA